MIEAFVKVHQNPDFYLNHFSRLTREMLLCFRKLLPLCLSFWTKSAAFIFYFLSFLFRRLNCPVSAFPEYVSGLKIQKWMHLTKVDEQKTWNILLSCCLQSNKTQWKWIYLFTLYYIFSVLPFISLFELEELESDLKWL